MILTPAGWSGAGGMMWLLGSIGTLVMDTIPNGKIAEKGQELGVGTEFDMVRSEVESKSDIAR